MLPAVAKLALVALVPVGLTIGINANPVSVQLAAPLAACLFDPLEHVPSGFLGDTGLFSILCFTMHFDYFWSQILSLRLA